MLLLDPIWKNQRQILKFSNFHGYELFPMLTSSFSWIRPLCSSVCNYCMCALHAVACLGQVSLEKELYKKKLNKYKMKALSSKAAVMACIRSFIQFTGPTLWMSFWAPICQLINNDETGITNLTPNTTQNQQDDKKQGLQHSERCNPKCRRHFSWLCVGFWLQIIRQGHGYTHT